jgi:NitT/TauT family transport system ATP-binding protein
VAPVSDLEIDVREKLYPAVGGAAPHLLCAALPAGPGKTEPVVGYVFQNPRLLPWRTVTENIRLVLNPEQVRSGIVEELLAATGLQDFPRVYPERLSVGMTRRVALARAFAVRPDLLLMDEPFVSLDEPTRHRLLLEIWGRRPTTVLFVTHDTREAVLLADRIVLMSPAPGTVAAEVPIDVPRAERADPGVAERLRQRVVGGART